MCAGLFYVVSAVIATQASTLWNFCFTELWVFSDREHKRGRGTRMALFFLMNNAALALRGPLLVLLTSGLGIHYVVSNVISLVGLTLVRFALADTWIWAKARPSDSPPGPYGYDIHGIVSVLSDARLPELERFRVGALAAEPDIRVRLGRVAANGDGPAIRYREGRLGFGVSIETGRADRGDGLAAGRSVASRPVHERRRADPALDVRRARLRARPRRLPGDGATTRSWSPPGPTRARPPRACACSTTRRTRSSPTT